MLTTEGLALSVLKSPLKIIPSPFPILLHFFPLVTPRLVSAQEPQKNFLTKYKHFLCKSFSSVNAQDDAHITRGQDQLTHAMGHAVVGTLFILVQGIMRN